LTLFDNLTNKKYAFITVTMIDLLVLTFEPKDKEYVGDHLLRLVISDDLGASTSYMLNMKILPLVNKGPPTFSPVPEKRSFRVGLG
jgi:hypothetical protein